MKLFEGIPSPIKRIALSASLLASFLLGACSPFVDGISDKEMNTLLDKVSPNQGMLFSTVLLEGNTQRYFGKYFYLQSKEKEGLQLCVAEHAAAIINQSLEQNKYIYLTNKQEININNLPLNNDGNGFKVLNNEITNEDIDSTLRSEARFTPLFDRDKDLFYEDLYCLPTTKSLDKPPTLSNVGAGEGDILYGILRDGRARISVKNCRKVIKYEPPKQYGYGCYVESTVKFRPGDSDTPLYKSDGTIGAFISGDLGNLGIITPVK
jgi:hypothetical protein